MVLCWKVQEDKTTDNDIMHSDEKVGWLAAVAGHWGKELHCNEEKPYKDHKRYQCVASCPAGQAPDELNKDCTGPFRLIPTN